MPRPLIGDLRRSVALVALLAALTPSTSSAQSQPASVPLVLARAGGEMLPLVSEPDSMIFTVDRLPEGWPAGVVPAASYKPRIIGGISSRVTRVAVFALSGNAAEARTALASSLEVNGWRRTGDGYERGVDGKARSSIVLCKDSSSASLLPITAGGDAETIMEVRILGGTSTLPSPHCIDHRTGMFMFADGAPEPKLEPPTGAKITGSHGSSSDGELTSALRVATTMPLAELVAFYSAQLERQGWHIRPPMSGAGMLVTQMETNKANTRYLGTLIAFDLGTERDVLIRVLKAPPQ